MTEIDSKINIFQWTDWDVLGGKVSQTRPKQVYGEKKKKIIQYTTCIRLKVNSDLKRTETFQ